MSTSQSQLAILSQGMGIQVALGKMNPVQALGASKGAFGQRIIEKEGSGGPGDMSLSPLGSCSQSGSLQTSFPIGELQPEWEPLGTYDLVSLAQS